MNGQSGDKDTDGNRSTMGLDREWGRHPGIGPGLFGVPEGQAWDTTGSTQSGVHEDLGGSTRARLHWAGQG